MRSRPLLRRLRRRFRTRQGAAWTLAALVLLAYAAMVAQQVRAAIREPGEPAAARLERADEARALASGPQRQ